jgi:hypothetical protein
VQEVGVVDDGNEEFSFGVGVPGVFDELFLSLGVTAGGFDVEGFAEDLEGVGVGVEGAADGGGDELFRVVLGEGVFDDAFTGSGFAHDDAEAALTGVDEEGVEDFLLVGEQSKFAWGEGVVFESEVVSDHGFSSVIS